MKLHVGKETKLLFIGDSITDCGRKQDEEKLGQGYVRNIHDYLAATDPAKCPIVINRGISGNKIPDLQNRWQRDVLDLAPDILSIYIGINDVWHGLEPGRAGCDIESFTTGFRDILTRARQALPEVKIVLCEPSVLWLSQHPGANEKLKPYVDRVHDLAREFHAVAVVELHAAFNSARAARPDIPWTTDGVHPTSAGHMLIAMKWLATTGLLQG
jgi:acyl-CoA thioesterase I